MPINGRIYVETSSIVAILKGEPEREEFLTRIDECEFRITSTVSVFEAALAVSELTGSCVSALGEVRRFLDISQIQIVGIEEGILVELAAARDRYGKGTGHPAGLNLGDCFSYAVAKTTGTAILYKGNDFAHTDMA